MATTVKDVAARAGVTPTVVSHVLHGKAKSIRVSATTAERVREAAQDLGYRVNVAARNFRDGQTMMIGVLHGIGFGRPYFNVGPRYFAALMDGIVDGAFDHGYSITLCPKLLGDSPLEAMADGRFDALIWYSSFPSEENLAMLKNCRVPVVLIHTPGNVLNSQTPSVRCNNEQGMRLALDHLLQLGHRRIAFALEGEDLFGEAAMRRDAFHAYMSQNVLPTDSSDVIDIHVDRSGARDYFSKGPRHTAVIGANDGVAASFIKLAPEYAVSVPNDLSVIGFDSTEYCEQLRPELTSVSQPLKQLGQTAVSLLVQAIAGNQPDPLDVILPCGLDVRSSTAISKDGDIQ